LEAPDEVWLFRGRRIHIPIKSLLKAIALVVMGVPLCHVESQLGIKAETVKRWLGRVLDEGRWSELAGVLEVRFGVPASDLGAFETAIVIGREFDSSAFRSWARELSRKSRAEQMRAEHVITRILGYPLPSMVARAARRRPLRRRTARRTGRGA
jgi:hypothetical protein